MAEETEYEKARRKRIEQNTAFMRALELRQRAEDLATESAAARPEANEKASSSRRAVAGAATSERLDVRRSSRVRSRSGRRGGAEASRQHVSDEEGSEEESEEDEDVEDEEEALEFGNRKGRKEEDEYIPDDDDDVEEGESEGLSEGEGEGDGARCASSGRFGNSGPSGRREESLLDGNPRQWAEGEGEAEDMDDSDALAQAIRMSLASQLDAGGKSEAEDIELQQAIALSLESTEKLSGFVTAPSKEEPSTVQGTELLDSKSTQKRRKATGSARNSKRTRSVRHLSDSEADALYFQLDAEGRGFIRVHDVARAAEEYGFLWDETQLTEMVTLFAQGQSAECQELGMQDFRVVLQHCGMLMQ